MWEDAIGSVGTVGAIGSVGSVGAGGAGDVNSSCHSIPIIIDEFEASFLI